MSETPQLLLVRDPRFRDHVGPPGHPERPERLLAAERALVGLDGHFEDVAARPATDEEILRVHSRAHLDQLVSIAGTHASLDPDTFASPRSTEVARLAAGGTIDLARAILRGDARRGFALVRPPGHHAERDSAMGFCLLNQVALAVRALQVEGIERIAVLDWDVHHGNGTQHAFETERDVLFVSTHQFPFYPGTGALAEQGRDAGAGATVNLPLPAGCGDREYARLFETVVLPVLDEFRPEFLIVSAGFDAHGRDPLAGMRLTTEGFRTLASSVRALADRHADGRLLLALEGGYDASALEACVRAVLETLLAERLVEAPPSFGDSLDAHADPREALVEKFREAHGAHWRSIRAR